MDREGKLKIVAVVGIILGIGILAGLFYWDKKDQEKVQSSISTEEEKKEEAAWELENQIEKEDSDWQRKMDKKSKGEPSVLVTVSSIDESLYTKIYPKMQEQGYKGMFALSDGVIPGEKDGEITREQFEDLLNNGWNYAFSITAKRDEKNSAEWLKALDVAIARWKENGIENPGILVCQNGQYTDDLQNELKNRGIHFIVEIKDKQITFEGDYKEDWHKMESVFLKEDYSNVTTMMKSAKEAGQSLGITLYCAKDQVANTEKELSVKKLDQFISQLEDMTKDGYQILSYGEYIDSRKKSNGELAEMKKEYEAFRKDKQEQLEQIDANEGENK